jgi:hypothetical protein
MYDHPLDAEYRQKFLRLKAEKEGMNYVPTASPGMGGFGMQAMNSKTQDPLIRAEAEKKIREQRHYYQ